MDSGDDLHLTAVDMFQGAFAEYVKLGMETLRIQADMSEDELDAVRAADRGWMDLAPAMAQLHPDHVQAAVAILSGAGDTLRRVLAEASVSYPDGIMAVRPSEETTTGNGATVERDWKAEVDRLEQRVAELEALAPLAVEAIEAVAQIRMTLAAAATVIASPMSGTGPPASSSGPT